MGEPVPAHRREPSGCPRRRRPPGCSRTSPARPATPRTTPVAQVDLFSRTLAAAPVPVAAKHRLLRLALAIGGPFLCDSCLVSNLGVIEPIQFGTVSARGDDPPAPRDASEVWFSTSAHMPRGLSLGVVTVGGQLRLTFRYRRALFRDSAAESFACALSRRARSPDRTGVARVMAGAGIGIAVAAFATTAYNVGLIFEKRALSKPSRDRCQARVRAGADAAFQPGLAARLRADAVRLRPAGGRADAGAGQRGPAGARLRCGDPGRAVADRAAGAARPARTRLRAVRGRLDRGDRAVGDRHGRAGRP